jgi:hypothetical protein
VVAPAAALLPNALQPKTAIPMGIALAWLGFAVWMERRTVSIGSADRELVKSS